MYFVWLMCVIVLFYPFIIISIQNPGFDILMHLFPSVSQMFCFPLIGSYIYFLKTSKAAMTSKGAKDTFATKLGFKSSSPASKAEAELDKIRKENAHLRRKIDEISRKHIKPPDSDKSKLLEVKEELLMSCIFCRSLGVFLYISMYVLHLSAFHFSFQRILSLETLRERNNQQLLVKEQELEAMRQQLTAKGGEV